MDFNFLDPTWFWTTLLMLFLGFIVYWHFSPVYSYWEKRGVPHEPAKSPLAIFFNLFTKQRTDTEIARYKKYGRVHGYFEGRTPILTIADPDLVRNILVKDFPAFPNRRNVQLGNPIFDNMLIALAGEKWKRIRSIISPTFSTGKIKRMTSIILSSAKTLACNFAAEAGKPVDAKKLYETFTMDVIASVAFATKIHSHQDPNNRFLQEAKKFFPSKISFRLILFALLPLQFFKFLGIDVINSDIINFFKEETLKIIEDRKKSGKSRNDFLQLLIEVERETREMENVKTEEEGKNVDDINAEELGHEENNAQIFKLQKGTKLSQDELIAQCVLFFLVGYLTTSSALAFATYELALNPEIQDKLRKEVDEVILNHDGALTYAGIQEMVYLDIVVSETLRMYPATIRIERIAGEDYKLGDTDIVVEKGKKIWIPIYAIHRDPEFYPEPEKFKPERFTAEGKASRHPYSYLAFGAGPRNCVAMRFALMEVKLCLAFIISQFNVKRCSETKVPLDIFAGLAFLDPKEVMLKFEKRENRIFDGLQENEEIAD